jgi:RNA recognition motif-containing protein
MNLAPRTHSQCFSSARLFARCYSQSNGIGQSPSYGKNTSRRLERRHILLKNVPTTATVSDVRRLVKRAGLNGVSTALILYKNFKPLGRALLVLHTPEYLVSNLRRLANTSIGGFSITATSADPLKVEPLTARTKDLPGKLVESFRQVGQSHSVGDPIHGPTSAASRSVTVSGLPGRLELSAVKHYFRHYDVLGQETGKHLITKVPIPEREFSLFSSYLIHLSSPSEAHRLVRNIHQTYFLPTYNGNKFKLQARILH